MIQNRDVLPVGLRCRSPDPGVPTQGRFPGVPTQGRFLGRLFFLGAPAGWFHHVIIETPVAVNVNFFWERPKAHVPQPRHNPDRHNPDPHNPDPGTISHNPDSETISEPIERAVTTLFSARSSA